MVERDDISTLEQLNLAVSEFPANAEPYIKRGKFYYSRQEFGLALNDFMQARKLDTTLVEAETYIRMINEILEFRHKDIYNP